MIEKEPNLKKKKTTKNFFLHDDIIPELGLTSKSIYFYVMCVSVNASNATYV